MYVPIRKSVTMLLFLLFLPGTGWADLMGQIGHFPTTSGSSWTFAGSGLTTDQSGTQVTQSFTETVTSNGGVFHSEIAFSGGNTTTSDNVYYQEDALYIGSTRIVKVSTTNIGVVMKTTTTSNNSYAPPQEFFPSELFAGNVETSSGSCTTQITTSSIVNGYPGIPSSSSKTSSENIKITVAGEEQITVGAGTFTAVKLLKELTVTEGGESYTTNITEWYAEGVGLVKMQSGYMNRDLVAYAVNPVEPSMFQISGNPGSFSTLQEALNSANNGNVIQMRDTTIQENLNMGNPADINLSGGWNSDYATVTGVTTLHGTLTLASGSMIVSNLSIY
jgi:hypothetical protein